MTEFPLRGITTRKIITNEITVGLHNDGNGNFRTDIVSCIVANVIIHNKVIEYRAIILWPCRKN